MMLLEELITGATIGGLFTIVATLVATLLATLISLLIWDRWIDKPNLIIKPIEGPGKEPPAIQQVRGEHKAFYHVNVKNEGRALAKNLRPRLVFHKDGHRVCSFFAKWDFNPEPLKIVLSSPGGKTRLLAEPSLMSQGALMDIPPDDEESFCMLIKYKGEDECYGFSAFSYLYSGLKNPKWKLGPGRYRVRLDLLGDNVHKTIWLKIECRKWGDVEEKGNVKEMFSYAVITNVEGELSSPLVPSRARK